MFCRPDLLRCWIRCANWIAQKGLHVLLIYELRISHWKITRANDEEVQKWWRASYLKEGCACVTGFHDTEHGGAEWLQMRWKPLSSLCTCTQDTRWPAGQHCTVPGQHNLILYFFSLWHSAIAILLYSISLYRTWAVFDAPPLTPAFQTTLVPSRYSGFLPLSKRQACEVNWDPLSWL